MVKNLRRLNLLPTQREALSSWENRHRAADNDMFQRTFAHRSGRQKVLKWRPKIWPSGRNLLNEQRAKSTIQVFIASLMASTNQCPASMRLNELSTRHPIYVSGTCEEKTRS